MGRGQPSAANCAARCSEPSTSAGVPPAVALNSLSAHLAWPKQRHHDGTRVPVVDCRGSSAGSGPGAAQPRFTQHHALLRRARQHAAMLRPIMRVARRAVAASLTLPEEAEGPHWQWQYRAHTLGVAACTPAAAMGSHSGASVVEGRHDRTRHEAGVLAAARSLVLGSPTARGPPERLHSLPHATPHPAVVKRLHINAWCAA
jgi:hypothetical protein